MSTNDYTDRLKELSPAKRALLMAALLQQTARKEQSQQIPRRSEPGPSVLSFGQQRLWLLDKVMPGSAAYNVPFAVRLKGSLEVAALKRSLEEIVRRHEILRTTFISVDEQPMQAVAPHMDLELPVTDLREAGAEAEREAEARRLASEEASRAFDLSRGPLLRAALLRLGDDEHVLLITMHHIVSDGWSDALLISEMVTLYEAFSRGEDSPLPELPIQYSDFASWQREYLQGEVLESLLSYWRQQLSGAITSLELPVDKPRPQVQSYRGAIKSFKLSKELSEALKALSQQEGLTLFMTLLAAFKVLLYRYTGQEEIIVGSPIANRNRIETESLIGFFVNMLVLRTRLSGELSFRDLLRQVQSVALGAYAHQDIPFERLVDELQPERDLSRTPLFQVAFVLENAQAKSSERTALALSPFAVEHKTAKYDLTLLMSDKEDGLAASIEYNTDLFDAETIDRMIAHFSTLLHSIVSDPSLPISRFNLLPPSERHTLLGWNDTSASFPVDSCIHDLFYLQVLRNPDAPALCFDSLTLSYEELNRRANQLAHFLKASDVGPEVMVGVCMERSLEMVVALLGVLKAGGAYVPLDPAYPKQRLEFMLDDTAASIVLTQQHLKDSLPERPVSAVCLDSDWPLIARNHEHNPDTAASIDNAAYVIYTSGSTGNPKGVTVTHRNVARLFEATRQWFDFDHKDVWTLFHSYAFDFSVWEIWGALMYGGRLVVVPYFVSRSPEAFLDLLIDEKVTVLNQTPSAFRQLIHADESSVRSEELSLRRVIFGGEALELQNLRPWIKRHGDERIQLINMYGITETTVHVTYRRIMEKDVLQSRGSVVGGPIPDLQVYILDRQMQPVPIGIAGEMYVGGEGLARGYLNRPDLTAERFVPNEFGGREGGRLYRTGDLARFLPSADIEYLGRIDHQVKIRGFRIELDEIQSLLNLFHSVRDCVVVLHQDKEQDKRLVAYIVGEAGQEVRVSEVRAYLKEKLPDYMIPSAFVMLEQMPLTVNGKLDRRALPAPDSSRPELEEDYLAPETPIQQFFASVWMDALGVDMVGITDNFFALGGDSMRSLQVVARAQASGFNISVQDIYLHQTIRELAREIEAASGAVEETGYGYEDEEDPEMAQFLEELEQLADNDVQTRIKEKL